MKKLFIFFITLILLVPTIYAEEIEIIEPVKEPVTLVNCLSASVQWVEINNEVKVIQLIAYDSEDGTLNKEIDNYVCNLLNNATKIEIEYDEPENNKNQYNRELVWLWIDDVLLQDDLIKKGYGQVNYVTGEYKYLSQVCESQKQAIIGSLGIWNYPSISEKYCNSGVNIGQKEEIIEEDKNNEKKIDTKNLWYMVFINSGILLLTILLVKRVRKNGKR